MGVCDDSPASASDTVAEIGDPAVAVAVGEGTSAVPVNKDDGVADAVGAASVTGGVPPVGAVVAVGDGVGEGV
jgi:hypothetical protein